MFMENTYSGRVYYTPEVEIVMFDAVDVITTSSASQQGSEKLVEDIDWD